LIDADFFFEADASVVAFNVDLIVVDFIIDAVDFTDFVVDFADVPLVDLSDDVGFVDFPVLSMEDIDKFMNKSVKVKSCGVGTE